MTAYSGRNPIADAVRRATHTTTEKPPSAGQHIQAVVSIAGEQELRLDTHGSGNRRDWGGHIAISSDNLLIYLHDQVAARMYAAAWIDAWYIVSELPRPSRQARRLTVRSPWCEPTAPTPSTTSTV